MDEAFVQNAEHHVGGKDRGQNQDALPAQGILEHLSRPLESGGDRCGQPVVALEFLDGVDGLTKREPGSEVERDRHRRLLTLVIDLQGTDSTFETRHRDSGTVVPVEVFRYTRARSSGPI